MLKSDELKRLFRFVLVGGGFSLGYALLTAFFIGQVGTPPVATSVFLYALFIPLAYLVQKKFTFRNEQTNRASFLIYVSTQLFGIALVALVTTYFVTYEFLLDTALFLAAAVFSAAIGYIVNRIFAFKAA